VGRTHARRIRSNLNKPPNGCKAWNTEKNPIVAATPGEKKGSTSEVPGGFKGSSERKLKKKKETPTAKKGGESECQADAVHKKGETGINLSKCSI